MFEFSYKLHGQSAAFERRLGTDGEAYTRGEALALSGGRLTKCAATSTPQFICLCDQAAETTATTPLCVLPVTDHQVFCTTLAAAGTALKVGDAVTLHSDGLQVTATTTGGVFTLTALDGTAVGDTVHGRFLG